MSGKQLSLDSRMDLVQRLVTDRENGSQISESAENESDIEENPEENNRNCDGDAKAKNQINIPLEMTETGTKPLEI